MIHKMDFDNSYTVSVKSFKKQGGEFRLMPYKLDRKKYCDFFNDDSYIFPEFVKYSDFKLPLPCPLVKVNNQHNFN